MTYGPDMMVTDAVAKLRTMQIWRESACMKFRLTESQLDRLLDEFGPHCVSVGEEEKPLKAFMRHFVNWVYSRMRYDNEKSSALKCNTSKEQRDSEFASYVASRLSDGPDGVDRW